MINRHGSSARFLSLPREVLESIFVWCDGPTLQSTARVCRYLSPSAINILYRSINISRTTSIVKLFEAVSRDRSYSQKVRRLRIATCPNEPYCLVESIVENHVSYELERKGDTPSLSHFVNLLANNESTLFLNSPIKEGLKKGDIAAVVVLLLITLPNLEEFDFSGFYLNRNRRGADGAFGILLHAEQLRREDAARKKKHCAPLLLPRLRKLSLRRSGIGRVRDGLSMHGLQSAHASLFGPESSSLGAVSNTELHDLHLQFFCRKQEDVIKFSQYNFPNLRRLRLDMVSTGCDEGDVLHIDTLLLVSFLKEIRGTLEDLRIDCEPRSYYSSLPLPCSYGDDCDSFAQFKQLKHLDVPATIFSPVLWPFPKSDWDMPTADLVFPANLETLHLSGITRWSLGETSSDPDSNDTAASGAPDFSSNVPSLGNAVCEYLVNISREKLSAPALKLVELRVINMLYDEYSLKRLHLNGGSISFSDAISACRSQLPDVDRDKLQTAARDSHVEVRLYNIDYWNDIRNADAQFEMSKHTRRGDIPCGYKKIDGLKPSAVYK